MKFVILGICVTALALGACRRESPEYEPMKLGAADVSSQAAIQR